MASPRCILPCVFCLPVKHSPKSFKEMFVKVALDFNPFTALKPLNGALSSRVQSRL